MGLAPLRGWAGEILCLCRGRLYLLALGYHHVFRSSDHVFLAFADVMESFPLLLLPPSLSCSYPCDDPQPSQKIQLVPPLRVLTLTVRSVSRGHVHTSFEIRIFNLALGGNQPSIPVTLGDSHPRFALHDFRGMQSEMQAPLKPQCRDRAPLFPKKGSVLHEDS